MPPLEAAVKTVIMMTVDIRCPNRKRNTWRAHHRMMLLLSSLVMGQMIEDIWGHNTHFPRESP